MSRSYENFAKAIDELHLTSYRVAKDNGLPYSLFTNWKNNKSKPKLDKMKIIADYLNVSTAYLYGLDDKPPNNILPPTGIDLEIYKQIIKLPAEYKENLLFFLKALPKEDK